MNTPGHRPLTAVGLMSGTSADGVDAALVRIGPGPVLPVLEEVRAFVSVPYPPALRERVLEAAGEPGTATAGLCSLHREVGEAFAEAALAALEAGGVAPGEADFVASHGQTVRHLPGGGPGGRLLPSTLQIGDAAAIAERTGLTVVADFRARDVAAGGAGAPLTPWAHRVLFAREGAAAAFLNLGGISNLTYIPPRGEDGLLGFDCGPANMTLDAAAARLSGGRERFDRGGAGAARGRADEEVLAALLAHPFLAQPPPKSTGREAFGEGFAEKVLAEVKARGGSGEDALATLTAFSAECVLRAVRDHLPAGARPAEVIAGGGGVANAALMARLREGLAPIPLAASDARGIAPGAVEAVCFALLGWATLAGVAAGVPAATGARRAAVLGHITPGAGFPALIPPTGAKGAGDKRTGDKRAGKV